MNIDLLPVLLGSTLRAKVLSWLFSHSDERFFVRQLTGLIKVDSTNLSRELARLEKMGILNVTTSGKQKYYQANLHSPVFNELHGLIVKTAGAAGVLRSALEPLAAKISLAFIYGSVAKGTENRASDLDLMIVGEADYDEVSSRLNAVQNNLGREINSVIYPLSEFNEKIKTNHYFLKSVLESEKIYLIGDRDELARLVK